jgi:hypothetical protein
VQVAPARERQVGLHPVEQTRGNRQSVLLTAANHALIEQIGVRDTVTVNNLIHRYGRREPP